jgi:asparagine synthase (glutamine-hydrolysing)
LPRTPFARVATLESSLYLRNQLLRDTDWASMAHSLEVRVPLVDKVLLQQVAPLMVAAGRGLGKRLLAAAPSRPLPAAVVNRAKTGFTTPVGSWTAGQIRAGKPAGPAVRATPWARGWSRIVGAQSQVRL